MKTKVSEATRQKRLQEMRKTTRPSRVHPDIRDIFSDMHMSMNKLEKEYRERLYESEWILMDTLLRIVENSPSPARNIDPDECSKITFKHVLGMVLENRDLMA